MKNYLIFGSQGSGKTTFAPYISEKLNVRYLATGNLFRSEMQMASPLGEEIKERMNSGEVIDDETTWKILNPHIIKAINGFLLDGYPRNLTQAIHLDQNGYKIAGIFYITLPEEVAIQRLIRRGRHDDSREAIQNRLDYYRHQTLPVLDYYKSQQVPLFEIDNTPSVAQVRQTIDGYLKN